eukprot:CAMPEP_0201515428 /NCGR_PEP_ID=MMETSP0161_2-20130828/7001_1 /ASSEMBLY_ACC=CAM_ASM_000251 /TAXON_ID=180227 /ORGANISM="Neoparamoeba aestuarina, Strain SoJaBio B1-5/56/2" /LENGTH=84 /DNA_ID=CAMNT_0047912257 /DNA_START=1212 /DNA_END=1466 /DNA_ORIENTATION=-
MTPRRYFFLLFSLWVFEGNEKKEEKVRESVPVKNYSLERGETGCWWWQGGRREKKEKKGGFLGSSYNRERWSFFGGKKGKKRGE